MLVAAALVPETALLVPAAGGRADPVPDVRSAALEAVRGLVAPPAEQVVVVPGAATAALRVLARGSAGARRALSDGLAGAGVRGPVDGAASDGAAVDVAGAVALHLLAAVGSPAPAHVVPDPAAAAAMVAQRPSALLLMGSLSARRGPDGPLPDDPRAAAVEDALVDDLLRLDRAARSGLAALDEALLDDLAVSAHRPLRALLVAADAREQAGAGVLAGELLHRSAPFGATYVVVRWATAPGAGSTS